jgi:hypothetical protein
MIRVEITDEALKDLFLAEGTIIRPSAVLKGIPSDATLISSKVTGPGVMEMVWDLHDGESKITPAQIVIEANMPALEILHAAGEQI